MRPAAAKLRTWRENPIQFVTENFKVELDRWQEKALINLGGSEYNPRRRMALKACTGPGKSAVLAWAGWHRLSCFGEKGQHPKGAALSGEGRDNLRDNLWAELSKWQQKSEFLNTAFKWTGEKIFSIEHPATWFLSARSYAKDADSESIGRSLSGLHSKFPFILLDEIGDMPITVGQKSEQIFTGGVKDGLLLGAGNPTSTTGLLYRLATTLGELWAIITITADPDDPDRTPRVDIQHAKEQIKLHGRDNPWVMSTILGLFPPSGFNSLLGPDEVSAAMERHLPEDVYSFSQKRLGVDVALQGDDRTVIFPRQGLAAFRPVIMRNARPSEIAARVMQAKIKWESELEFVDGTGGYGSGVIDSLQQAGQSPIEVQFASKAIDNRYFNLRSEMAFKAAEWIKKGGALPKIPELLKEMTAPTYSLRGGKFLLEPKEMIKKRLGFSPDLFDALMTTFALPEMPRQQLYPGQMKENKLLYDFDPFDTSQL